MRRSPLPTPAAVLGGGGRKSSHQWAATLLALMSIFAMVAMINDLLRRDPSEKKTKEGNAWVNYTLPYCACAPRLGPGIGGRVPSSCTDFATSRGPGQRVVTYRYWMRCNFLKD